MGRVGSLDWDDAGVEKMFVLARPYTVTCLRRGDRQDTKAILNGCRLVMIEEVSRSDFE